MALPDLLERTEAGARVEGAASGPLEDDDRAFLAEIDDAQYEDKPIMRRIARMRARVARTPQLEVGYRVVVAAIGGALTLSGLALLALPGPGWLTVFLGLAVLGTEFHWARRIAGWLKERLNRAWAWWNRRRTRRSTATD